MAKNTNNRLLTAAKLPSSNTTIPADTEWGIDTVRLSIPINPNLCENDPSLWSSGSTTNYSDSGKTYNSLEYNHETAYGNVKVTYFIERELAKLEFNAARLLTPKSRELLPPKALLNLVSNILYDLQHLIFCAFDTVDPNGVITRYKNWADEVTITRLDVARNLHIPNSYEVKKALAMTIPKNGSLRHIRLDAKGGWTVSNETKRSGMDRLYDKSAELRNTLRDEELNQLEDGWFRFEAELVKERLKKNGLNKLSKVTDERVWSALEERWKATGWDVSIPEMGNVAALMAQVDGKLRVGLLGYLVAASKGIDHGLSESTVRKYNKIAKNLGVVVGTKIDEIGPAIAKLDLFEGGVSNHHSQ